jgi:hypothetical protein
MKNNYHHNSHNIRANIARIILHELRRYYLIRIGMGKYKKNNTKKKKK